MNRTQLTALVQDMTPEQIVEGMFIDPVSGLPNRRAFERDSDYFVVAILDMDSLKWVNDHLGHVAGDKILRQLGEALIKEFPDHAYHLSGDEFVVTAKHIPELSGKLVRLQEQMQGRLLAWPVSGGHWIDLYGAGAFSFGIGSDLNCADQSMQENKAYRQARGRRAKRGEAPPGVMLRREAKLADLI